MARPSLARALALAMALIAGASASALAQNTVITGKVTSQAGDPLGGATVSIPTLNLTVSTAVSGTYTLTVAGERVRGQTVELLVRFIGFKPATSQLTLSPGTHTANVALEPDVNRLTEIVTVGVTEGTERVKLPFSVGTINMDDMAVPAVNPLTQLQGKVAGARIVGFSGRPGAAPAVQLRGPTSLNSNGRSTEPLYVVDGVIINGSLPDFNTMDIESIEVVKGAAAAALYGTRAGNGVITIKTRTGSTFAENRVRFDSRSEVGFSNIEHNIGLAQNTALLKDETGRRFCVNNAANASATSCAGTIDYLAEAYRINDQGGVFSLAPPAFPIDPGSTLLTAFMKTRFQSEQWGLPLYNQVDQFAKPQPTFQQNVSMTGRFGATNLFASVSHLDQGGSVRYLNGFQRTTGRVNIGQQVTDKLRVEATSQFARGVSDGGQLEGNGRTWFRLTRVPAQIDLLRTDSQGRLLIRPNLQAGGQQNENPIYWLQNEQYFDRNDRFVGSANMRYSPFSWLDADASFGYDKNNIRTNQFRNKGFRTTSNDATTNSGFIQDRRNAAQALNAGANLVARASVGDLKIRGSLRYLFEQQDYDLQRQQGNFLAAGGIDNAANITTGQAVVSQRSSVRGIGYFAGVNLDFKDRYILDGLVRRDGSSLFGANERWQWFGRASGAWRVSQEPWWPLKRVVDEFKLRGSYGSAGNRPAFTVQYETFDIGSGGVLTPNLLGNSNLKPEVVKEWEAGAEAQIFGILSINFTYAQSNTVNQILPVPLSFGTGFGTQWQNAGTLLNRTTELEVSAPLVNSRNFSYTIRGTLDRNRSYIKKLSVPPFTYGSGVQGSDAGFQAKEGERVGSFYGRGFATTCADLPAPYNTDCGTAGSSFQLNDEGWLVWTGSGNGPGDGITKNLWQAQLPAASAPWGVSLAWGMPILLRDAAGNPLQKKLGNALPDFRFSIGQDFRWKRLSISALVDATMGIDVYNEGRHWSYLDFNSIDNDQAGKTVSAAKPLGYYYRASESGGVGGFYDILAPNQRFVENASYAKLRELSVSYRIGTLFGVGDFTASLIGRNLFTVTGYTGFDPEVGVFTQALTAGQIIQNTVAGPASNAFDAFTFPNLRTLTFALQTSF